MEQKPVTYAFIFARGGSKGLPRKNILSLAGKPLIAHSIELAKSLKEVSRVIVSTDDIEIADIAKQWGAEVPFMRPKELASDTAPERLAWQHALHEVGNTAEGGPCEIFLSLPCTAPLRNVSDVENCLEVYYKNDCDVVITTSPAQRHPMFNMVYEDMNGDVKLAMESNKKIVRRQDAPILFDITTAAYVVRPSFVFSDKELLQGRVRQVVLPRERAIDIDDALDFAFAEFLVLQQAKLINSKINLSSCYVNL